MEAIAQYCAQLRVLDVSNSHVTNDGLKMLADKCTQLQQIRLRYCFFVNPDGVRLLLKARPGIRIYTPQDEWRSLSLFKWDFFDQRVITREAISQTGEYDFFV